MTEPQAGMIEDLRERGRWLRTGPRAELVTNLAFLAALGLATVHWLGLVAGGAVLGLTAPTFRRALVYGVYLGFAVALAFVGWLWLAGALSKAISTGLLFGLSLASAVVLPILGSAVRGLW